MPRETIWEAFQRHLDDNHAHGDAFNHENLRRTELAQGYLERFIEMEKWRREVDDERSSWRGSLLVIRFLAGAVVTELVALGGTWLYIWLHGK